MNKGAVIIKNTGKSYKELKEFGLFELMPNGFNVYLDDEDMVKSDDSYYAHLEYSLDEGVYKTPNGITVTSEELMESEVTFIGSDPMGDFEVPALWIIPDDSWYMKHQKTTTVREPYEMVAEEIKSDNIDPNINQSAV